MFDFLTKVFGIQEKPKATASDFRSIKVHNKTYDLIKQYAIEHKMSKASVVYIAIKHLQNLEKSYAPDTNQSN